jgi:hypothetical protein
MKVHSIIKLDELYTLEMEPSNFVLRYAKPTGEKTEKGKEIVSKDTWYYPRLSQALKTYINASVKPCEDVKEMYEKLIELETKLDKYETIKN